MSGGEHASKLAKDIDHYLGALSRLYTHNGQQRKLAIITNAQVTVREGWNYDNWNGGTTGHALFLALPDAIFIDCVKDKDQLQSEIAEDINKLHNVQNESIDAVFLELERTEDKNWRDESGALLRHAKPFVASAAIARIWVPTGFRVFLSHKTEVKKETAELKAKLQLFGVSSFVAHEDIHPTQMWQDEIESALRSMDAFVALLTDKFHESLWTDQEVGFAVGRAVPIIAVRLGRDPYGFIGKFQALSCSWENAPVEIVRLLMPNANMLEAYLATLANCKSFDHGNLLAKALPSIKALSPAQEELMVNTYNANDELRGAFGFNGVKPRDYGKGLPEHLLRVTGHTYEFFDRRELRLVK